MTEEKIEAIIDKTVKKAIRGLKDRGAIKSQSEMIYKDISRLLRSYYKNDEINIELERALEQLRNDMYFEVIPLYFDSDNTIEHLAKKYGVDDSTIVRNKKRLCLEIYDLMGEENA